MNKGLGGGKEEGDGEQWLHVHEWKQHFGGFGGRQSRDEQREEGPAWESGAELKHLRRQTHPLPQLSLLPTDRPTDLHVEGVRGG